MMQEKSKWVRFMDRSARLIALRKKIGLSQNQLASEFGVSRGALTHWESGKRPIPEMAMRLIEIYEEFVDEDLALKRHEDVTRKLTVGWTKRLMSSFANGARKNKRKQIHEGLETSLYNFFRHELSSNQIKRHIQVSIFDRMVIVASQSRGLPMKLVQAMTFLNPSMDQKAREALEQIHLLQCPMAPTLVAKIISEDLGQSPSKLFAEWSPKPFATASIGQVHRARLKTGEEVAVKVQYPDIQKSLSSDLASLGFFADMIGSFNPEVRDIVGKLQEALLNEADYIRERSFLEIFGKIFAESDNIIIPKVYGSLCSQRVLTMDYIEGKTLAEFKTAAPEERKIAAETLAIIATVTTFKAEVINTDTNAGNFIFCPGGKVGFIDFGRASQVNIEGLDSLLKAVIHKDINAAKTILPAIFAMKEKSKGDKYPFDEIWSFFLSQQAHLHAGDFVFSRDYIARILNEGKNFSHKKDIQTSIEMIWSMATSMGLWNVLADLDVAVDYGKISLNVLA